MAGGVLTATGNL